MADARDVTGAKKAAAITNARPAPAAPGGLARLHLETFGPLVDSLGLVAGVQGSLVDWTDQGQPSEAKASTARAVHPTPVAQGHYLWTIERIGAGQDRLGLLVGIEGANGSGLAGGLFHTSSGVEVNWTTTNTSVQSQTVTGVDRLTVALLVGQNTAGATVVCGQLYAEREGGYIYRRDLGLATLSGAPEKVLRLRRGTAGPGPSQSDHRVLESFTPFA